MAHRRCLRRAFLHGGAAGWRLFWRNYADYGLSANRDSADDNGVHVHIDRARAVRAADRPVSGIAAGVIGDGEAADAGIERGGPLVTLSLYKAFRCYFGLFDEDSLRFPAVEIVTLNEPCRIA